jgi:succinate-semialdehyde dehydrogenase/glutarate-semialdehyde dehydrogenase
MKAAHLLSSRAYINGNWVAAGSGETFEVVNPATGEHLASVPDMNAADTLAAIDSAHKAWQQYRHTTAKERANLLQAWHAAVLEEGEALAELMTLESGKVITESKGELAYGAAFIEWYAAEARRTYGEVIPSHTANRRLMVIRQPVGVAAAITPWNFPLAMITRKLAPALAAGCTVVLKPPAETPLTALALTRLAEKAGFPPGVINTITTTRSSEVGEALCQSPLVRKLSFTGSTAVGKQLMANCAPTLKKLSLELGGNAPFLVFADADLDAAVAGALLSKYRHNGQTCVCANRLLVEDSIYDAFVERFTAAVASLRTGPVLHPDVQVGPLINEKGMKKVEALVSDAVEKGARVAVGGHRQEGLFYAPTVLTEVRGEMRIAREEVFGPVAPIFRFYSEEEAIRMANDTEYGLAAYFYSLDVRRCWRVAEALEYGMVGINEGLISTEVAPFGGIKESGMGREGGRQGIDEYLELKYLCHGGL